MIATAPMLVDGMSDAEYHGDREHLSQSGAKLLLPPSCPAKFKWVRDNGRAPRRAFDFGHAAHAVALGRGLDLVVVDAPDWRTKAAKEAQDAARTEGKVPLLAEEMARVNAMAEKLHEHPIARVLLDPDGGAPEQSAFWVDEATGVPCRARFDWLPHGDGGGRMIISDYKTAVSANPIAFGKSSWDYGYAGQDQWYTDAARALGLADDLAFVFIVQEKEPPYIVTVVELDAEAKRIGRERNRLARDTYAECVAADRWPGYTDDVALASLPGWAVCQHEESL